MIGPRIAANEYYTNIQVAAFKKTPRENDVLGVLRKCNLSSTLLKKPRNLLINLMERNMPISLKRVLKIARYHFSSK